MRKRQQKCKHIWIDEPFDGHDVSKCEVCGLTLSVFFFFFFSEDLIAERWRFKEDIPAKP